MYGVYGLGCIHKKMRDTKFNKAFFHLLLYVKQIFQASQLYAV